MNLNKLHKQEQERPIKEGFISSLVCQLQHDGKWAIKLLCNLRNRKQWELMINEYRLYGKNFLKIL